MDIDSHLRLRSFTHANVSPIMIALAGAFILHIFFGIKWYANQPSNMAVLPEWVNIKLTASFEKPINKVEKAKPKKKTVKRKEKKIKKYTKAKKEEQRIKEIKPSFVPTTTFVKANSQPYMLENEKPVYPEIARRRGMFGVVLLRLQINKKGFVDNVYILKTSGFKILDYSALSSVKTWRFIPAKKGNSYISSEMEIPIRFVLNDI